LQKPDRLTCRFLPQNSGFSNPQQRTPILMYENDITTNMIATIARPSRFVKAVAKSPYSVLKCTKCASIDPLRKFVIFGLVNKLRCQFYLQVAINRMLCSNGIIFTPAELHLQKCILPCKGTTKEFRCLAIVCYLSYVYLRSMNKLCLIAASKIHLYDLC
jgi:hypothetical protein